MLTEDQVDKLREVLVGEYEDGDDTEMLEDFLKLADTSLEKCENVVATIDEQLAVMDDYTLEDYYFKYYDY